MAAWVIYHAAKGYLASGGMGLDSDAFGAVLCGLGSNAGDPALSTRDQLTLALSGTDQALTGVAWEQGASAGEMRFKCADMQWLGPLDGVRHVVLYDGTSRKLLCQCQTYAAVPIPPGAPFMVVIAAAGVFKLV